MALVGPRPEQPALHYWHADSFGPTWNQRVAVKPGLTGLAQLHGGRGGAATELKLYYDLQYTRRRSRWLDLWILLRTPWAILRGRA